MTPEDVVIQAAEKLIEALKLNLTTAMDESVIDQINKLYAIFNTTAKNFLQIEENQNQNIR